MTSTVVILGSPRKGNSEAIAMAIANEAKAKGRSTEDNFTPCLLFVIQMDDVSHFEPNRATDPEFANALREAYKAGVTILAYTCDVTPESIVLKEPVEVRI